MAEWSRLSSDCALFLAKAWRHGAAERQTDAMDRDTCAVTHLLHLQCCHMYVHCWNSVDMEKTCNYLHDYFTMATVPLHKHILHRNFGNYVTHHARIVVMVTVPHAKLTYSCSHDDPNAFLTKEVIRQWVVLDSNPSMQQQNALFRGRWLYQCFLRRDVWQT
jgi:hypothetical protein